MQVWHRSADFYSSSGAAAPKPNPSFTNPRRGAQVYFWIGVAAPEIPQPPGELSCNACNFAFTKCCSALLKTKFCFSVETPNNKELLALQHRQLVFVA